MCSYTMLEKNMLLKYSGTKRDADLWVLFRNFGEEADGD